MKQKCKICGLNAESEYCFRHKKKRHLPAGRAEKLNKTLKKAGVDLMKNFFLEIWRSRVHISAVSMTFLGHEPLSVFFHHILPKGKYPQAQYDEENIILLTLQEHEAVELDMYKYEEINIRRKYLKTKYNLS